MRNENRVIWVDFLNIAGCIGVLLLHCTNRQVHEFNGVPDINWLIGLFTHSAILWPVNIFFMLSGYTLLIKLNNSGGVFPFYKRRFQRVGIPLIGWNCFYALVNCSYKLYTHKSIDVGSFLSDFVQLKCNGFMWFFIPLIVIYISLPFMAIFVQNATRQMLKKFLIIGFILISIVPMLTEPLKLDALQNLFPMGGSYLYLAVAGYYIGQYGLSYRTRKYLYISTIISIILIFGGMALILMYANPSLRTIFLAYTHAPCMITSLGVFTFFKYVDWTSIMNKIHISWSQVIRVSEYSFGIYLVQGLVFMATSPISKHCSLFTCVDLLRFLYVYPLCILTVYMMKHIPVLKRFVP